MIQKNPALFLQAAKFPANKVPAALAAKLVAAAGGGTKGLAILGTIQLTRLRSTASSPSLRTCSSCSRSLLS